METRSSRRRCSPSARRAVAIFMLFSLITGACGSVEPTTTLALTDEQGVVETSRQVGSATTALDGPATALDPAESEPVSVPAPTPTPAITSAPEVVVPATTPPVADEEADVLSTWVATATDQVTHLVAYDAPGGSVIPFEFLVPNPHQFGGPQALMVTEGQPGDAWVEVQLPIRPNGQTGWIDASLYTFSQTQIRAEVNLSTRSVTVYDGTDIIAQTQAVIGSSQTPTPIGTFFVTAKRRNPASESYIGPWALALSGFSEVYETFSGGLPVIAIHGTNAPHQVGEARSNGCLRISNDVVTLLAETVPLGAPVIITQ